MRNDCCISCVINVGSYWLLVEKYLKVMILSNFKIKQRRPISPHCKPYHGKEWRWLPAQQYSPGGRIRG